MRLLVVLLLSLATLPAAEELWVQVDFWNQEAQQTDYFFGKVEAEVYRAVLAGERDGGFITLRETGWWEFDEEGEELVGVSSYADEFDNGVVSIRLALIEKIREMTASPQDILAERQAGVAPF